MARCLTEVARWLVGERRVPAACAMAELRSPLASRVKRILQQPPRAREPRVALGAVAVALVWGGTALAAPGFRSTDGVHAGELHGEAPPAGFTVSPLTRDLGLLVGAVDAELAQLQQELAACAGEMQRNGASAAQWSKLEDIHRRVRRVRASRKRVQQVLTRLETALSASEPGPGGDNDITGDEE